MLLALSPGRSRSWWLASRRPAPVRRPGVIHGVTPPGSVPAPSCPWYAVAITFVPRGVSGNRLPVSDPGGVSGNRLPSPTPEGYQAIGSPSPTPEGYQAIGSSSPTPEGYLAIGFRLRPRRGRTLNNPRSSRGREGERSEASRHRATWGYRWSASKDLGEVSRGRRHAGGANAGGVAGGCGRGGRTQADVLICPAVHVRPLRGLSTLLALSPGRSRSWWLASRRPAPVRRPGVIHGVTPPGSVPAPTVSPRSTLGVRCWVLGVND